VKIITCLKEVPGRETRYEVNSEGKWIKEIDLTREISECDEYALEEALKLQEKHGGEVVILTVGPAQAEKSIRKGLAMGAGRAILIQDEEKKLSSPHAVAAAHGRGH
jgi:electron transfer flavoprotein beta subunit